MTTPQPKPTIYQTVVLMRADVAPQYCDTPWEDLLVIGTQTDGLQVIQAPQREGGYLSPSWVTNPQEVKDQKAAPQVAYLTPKGWASYYLSKNHRPPKAALLQQNY